MNTRRTGFAIALLVWSAVAALADEELARIWQDPHATVQQRAAAVNRVLTNGTPVSVVVAALGTNYTRCMSSARVWAGPKPEPANSMWLSYRFGGNEVTLETSAVFGKTLDPLASKFTGAGYTLTSKASH